MRRNFLTGLLIGMLAVQLNPANASDQNNLDQDTEIPVRGIVIATKEAAISSSITAPITDINGRVGDVFERGEKLISFDCGLLEAQKETAQLELDVARAEHDNNLLLQKRGAIAGHDVVLSKFAIKRANATLKEFDEQLRECVIEAPFRGSFEEINVKLLQIPSAGNPVMHLVSHEDFEIELIVPSSWLAWIKKGSGFTIVIEEANKELEGEILRLGSKIDPVSQTINVYGKVSAEDFSLIPGMSGLVKMKRYK